MSTIDLFATILDYTGRPGHTSQGRSLRALIEGSERDGPDYCVSERPLRFMVRTQRWKLIFHRKANSDSLDALYDLQADPHELINLTGTNPGRERYRQTAEAMKARLVRWLERVDSPYLDEVRRRPAIQ